jgi:DNA-binding transcriptional LysR family regulator
MPWSDQIRRRLKLNDLHILLTVAQVGSMGKAAKLLALSQPAVSKAVGEMERTLNVKLLDRTAQGAEPTFYGRALLKWAAAAFDDLRQGVNELDYLDDPTRGELRVGATGGLVAGLLPEIIHHMLRDHPRIQFKVSLASTAAGLYRELRERDIDLILGRVVSTLVAEDIDSEELFNDPQFVVAGITNPLARRRNIELRELIDQPWTLPGADRASGAMIAETFHACGLELPRTAVVTSSIELHNALLFRGPYLALYPKSLLHFSARHLAIKPLLVKLPQRPAPVAIITVKNRIISPVARLFIETARMVAKPLMATK